MLAEATEMTDYLAPLIQVTESANEPACWHCPNWGDGGFVSVVLYTCNPVIIVRLVGVNLCSTGITFSKYQLEVDPILLFRLMQ